MKDTLKILFAEDAITDAELIWREINKNGIAFNKLLVDNKKDYYEGLKSFYPDLIISDYSMPGFNGMEALLLRNEHASEIPFILVTGAINEETAVECMKAGANDYVLKDKLSRLGPAILNSLKNTELLKQKKNVEDDLKRSEERYRLLVEKSPDAIAMHHEGKLIFINSAGAKLVGAQSPQELIGRSIIDVIHPDSRKKVIDRLQQLTEGREAPLMEEKFVKLDGSVIDVEVIGIPIPVQGHLAGQVIIRDITARKLAVEALKESEEKFRSIMENSADAIFLTDLNGKYMYTNKAVTEMLGFTSEEMKSKTILDIAPGNRKNEYFEIFNELLNKGKVYSEVELLKKNDDLISTDLNAAILPGGFIYGSCRDITERKKAEGEIIHQRRTLRTLIDNLPDMIYVKDFDCRKVIANKADVCNIGFKEETMVLGKTDIELFPGQTGERGYADDKNVINSGVAIFDREEDFIDKKGVRRWLLTTKIPLHDKDGKISGLVGIGHDITERRRAESELLQSYKFSESLLKTIPFAMDIVDETGTVLYQSDIFKMLFEKEGIGKKCWEMYRDDKEQCSNCPLKDGITIGKTEAYESDGILGNRLFEINHTGMMYQGKKAMLEIFQDITDRKENEQKIIWAMEKAEESDRLKTAFLHNISHEIRTPMNAIVGFSTLLGEPDIDVQTQQSYIETIMQSSNHLLSIITDIIDISNIEANIIKISRNEINVNSTLISLCSQFSPKAEQKKVELKCISELSDNEALILTDSTKLIQIVSNLISNALKFTDEGLVKVYLRRVDNTLQISVSDSGIGIPEEYHEKIFGRFYQVQNTISRLYEGTGLGLAISKAYVELMGGKILVSSEPGKGTTFTFTIPYVHQIIAEELQTEKSVPVTFKFKRKMRILVAEDVDSNFKLISYFLSGTNTETLRANNGKEAVEKCLGDRSIDLILMDIKMPEMDGYSATKIIRENGIKIPIIAQTAYADDMTKALESGCSGFISKPFDKKSLLSIISEFL